jgi:hypothetical protein
VRKFKLLTIALLALLALAVVTAGCGASESSGQDQAKENIKKKAEERVPYEPVNDVEFSNYNKAQELYDSPSTIIWCSIMPQASTAPIITVPIAGKLTSSSTTFFRPEEVINDESGASGNTVTSRSVDGLYHPDPPKYRYGFTPGGQYWDFFELSTACTTQPLAFQRQSVEVSVDKELSQASNKAEKALEDGDKAKAQAILEAAAE